MRIKVTKSYDGKWYQGFVDKVFEVEENKVGYTLLDTEMNRQILNQEKNIERRQQLFRRISNTGAGLKLGVSNRDCILVDDITSNKQGAKLLSQEW